MQKHFDLELDTRAKAQKELRLGELEKLLESLKIFLPSLQIPITLRETHFLLLALVVPVRQKAKCRAQGLKLKYQRKIGRAHV